MAPYATPDFTLNVVLIPVGSGGRLNQESGDHMPAFPCKNVVSAACRQRVHGFQADTQAHQAAQKSWGHKAQKRATAKDHEFRAEAGNFLKMSARQVCKAPAWPDLAFAARANEHAAVDFFSHTFAGQPDPARAIAKNRLGFKTIWLEFHAVRIRAFEPVEAGYFERGS